VVIVASRGQRRGYAGAIRARVMESVMSTLLTEIYISIRYPGTSNVKNIIS